MDQKSLAHDVVQVSQRPSMSGNADLLDGANSDDEARPYTLLEVEGPLQLQHASKWDRSRQVIVPLIENPTSSIV